MFHVGATKIPSLVIVMLIKEYQHMSYCQYGSNFLRKASGKLWYLWIGVVYISLSKHWLQLTEEMHNKCMARFGVFTIRTGAYGDVGEYNPL